MDGRGTSRSLWRSLWWNDGMERRKAVLKGGDVFGSRISSAIASNGTHGGTVGG